VNALDHLSPEAKFLLAVGLTFVAGFVFIALGQLSSARRVPDVWRQFRIQILVTTWMVVPAFLGGPAFHGAILLMAAVASWELFGILETLGLTPHKRIGVLMSVAYCVLALVPDVSWLYAAPVLSALAMLASPVLGSGLQGSYASAAATLLGSFYPGLCLAFAARLDWLGNRFGDFVFLYAVLEVNDVFAFLFGKYLGRARLAPLLSPNKTRIGSAGGLLCACLGGAVFAPVLLSTSPYYGAALGLVLGVIGQIADLTASAIKRQAGVKDYADTVPTQGGILDLYDAFIFAAPLWFIFRAHLVPNTL
jgi:phosphatidate cytidylyltransferase